MSSCDFALPELLAPAGNETCLHAAVQAGADAVYLGLDSLNARRGADNFTLETLGDACDYAHLRAARVYVTMNTVVLQSEFARAMETARQAYRAGADAFIVQDLGLASELSRTLPQVRLHVSTQMNIHNVAGVQACAELGAARITLARELSLEEVAVLADAAAQLGMEVETFAHGALCVCYSGQCLMSSLIGGRSANRGMCAQACRLPYELRNVALARKLPQPGEHLLSPQDLCAIDLLPQLARAGVASFKVEGRMKSPEYVFAVVSAYRRQLQRMAVDPEGSPKAADGDRQSLSEAFSRGFTTAYLERKRGNDIMSYGRPNNRGVLAGRVAWVRDGRAGIDTVLQLAEGDVLEFWTNKGHFAHTVSSLATDGRGCAVLAPAKPVGKGDRVFRVRSAAAAFVDNPLLPRVAVDGSASLVVGQPLSMSFRLASGEGSVAALDEGRGADSAQSHPFPPAVDPAAVGSFEGQEVEAARTRAVTAEDVGSHVDRLGQTEFALSALDVTVAGDPGIGFSAIHKARSAALDDLRRNLLAPTRARMLERSPERPFQPAVRGRGMKIAVWATNPACARAAKRAGADLIYVPALNYKRGEAVVAGQRSATAEQAGYPKQAVIALPVAEHDLVGGTREAARGFDAWSAVHPGKPVYVESLGQLSRAVDMGAVPHVGSHLPLTNPYALDEAAALGAQLVWLSPELTLGQIADLAQDAPCELGLTIIGAQELMVTEHCLLMSEGPCDERCDVCPRRKSPHYLRDRKDYEFPVITDCMGRSHLFNGVQLDVAHAMPDLMVAGLSWVMVDTTLMTSAQTSEAVARAVRARSVAHASGNAIGKAAGTTAGHLYRGVS